jgi:hypothetical protein
MRKLEWLSQNFEDSNGRVKEMTNSKFSQTINQTITNSSSNVPERFSGTIENWLQCRQERLRAQFILLHGCRSEEDIELLKTKGFLNFDGTSLK